MRRWRTWKMDLNKEIKKSDKRVGRLWCWWSKLKVKRKERKLNLKEILTLFRLITYLESFNVLPCFGGVQRISHKIELSPYPYYIIKMNKNEMIRNLEEENIIMKYRWRSHKNGYTDASRFTWMLIITKREKVEK